MSDLQLASNYIDNPFDLSDKYCDCGHKAYSIWEWAPGHHNGYKCVCCIKKIWEETLGNVKKGIKELPKKKCC